MKHFFAVGLGLFFALGLGAQQVISVTPEQYQQLKDARQLNTNVQYQIVEPIGTRSNLADARVPAAVSPQSVSCNCMVPLDTTFSVVPFQFSTPPEYRNDDASSNAIAIPFSFNFFGTLHDSIFINNNGNISFNWRYSAFSASPFPSIQYSMIAPFWADVDTRSMGSGLVYYKIAPGHVIIRWDSVGYYSMHADKRSTFQLIITDGLDTILPPGTNVAFCYGDMQWTTGDASNGVNGFGGTPSTTGVNQGNGVDYFQVTQSIDSTYNFDGPYNAPDGISWLDDLQMSFNTAITGNVPPLVMNNLICDTIDVYTGDTIRISAIDSIEFEFYSLTPEFGQTVSTVITTNAPVGALTYIQTLGANEGNTYHCIFDARNMSPGSYWVTATATDDGSPALTASSTIYINTYYSLTTVDEVEDANPSKVYPNPTNGVLNIEHSRSAISIDVYDVNGMLLRSSTTSGSMSTIDTRDLSAGIYFVQVVDGDGSIAVNRFVKY